MKRFKTKYPGVFYREADRIGGPGKEKVFYIVFKKGGKVQEEKAGRQYADDMTAARAARYSIGNYAHIEVSLVAEKPAKPAN